MKMLLACWLLQVLLERWSFSVWIVPDLIVIGVLWAALGVWQHGERAVWRLLWTSVIGGGLAALALSERPWVVVGSYLAVGGAAGWLARRWDLSHRPLYVLLVGTSEALLLALGVCVADCQMTLELAGWCAARLILTVLTATLLRPLAVRGVS